MNALQLMQLLGGVALLAGFAATRLSALRPHARAIGLAVLCFYVLAGVGVVIWRIVAGP